MQTIGPASRDASAGDINSDIDNGKASDTAASPPAYAVPAPSPAPSLTASRASSAPASRPNSAAALAFQQASEAYHEALMQKRLGLVEQMRAALADTSTVAYQSIAAYSHCLEGQALRHLCIQCLVRDLLRTPPTWMRANHAFCSTAHTTTQSAGSSVNYGFHAGVLTDIAFEVFQKGQQSQVCLPVSILLCHSHIQAHSVHIMRSLRTA